MKRTTVAPLLVDMQYEIDVAEPYRLDLTVSVLRRLSTNIVDILTADGAYVRVLDGPHGPVIVRVTQRRSGALAVTFARREAVPGERAWALGTVRRMLGVERRLSRFDRAAREIPWLKPLAARMRGVKPPRYPTLWEACVNAIVFQQVSLVAASSISRRLITALGVPERWATSYSMAFRP